MTEFILLPGAVAEPIDTRYLTDLPLYAHNRMNVHVAGNQSNPGPYFNDYGRPSSLCWVDKTGLAHQYVSLGMRAEADFEGNDATYSFETQNSGSEPFTQAQIETLARAFAFLRATKGLANQLAISSKLGQESKGLSWHRLGIDGNFPELPSPYAGRLQRGGGMRYSTSFGKICPGNPVIDQMQNIFNLSQVIDVDVPIPPVVIPAPKPVPPVVVPSYRILKEDGWWGTNTTLRLQDYFNTPEDGVISHQWEQNANKNILSCQFDKTKRGSTLVRAMQTVLGGNDGLIGPNFVNALESKYGVKPDGFISGPSETVSRMQRALNENRF